MHKETVTYTDYNGVERKETFYFNMNEAELIEMQYGTAGGLDQTIKKIIEAQDQDLVICTAGGSYEFRAKLSDYEQTLVPEGFFRIHRSYMVALSKITNVSGRELTVVGGYKLPVARAKEKEFKDAFMSFVSREAF